jgi:hypothetical protein
VREDGTKLVRNRHATGVAWWVHIAGHDTPLQIKGQSHLRRAWTTPLKAMQAANREYPLSAAKAGAKKRASKKKATSERRASKTASGRRATKKAPAKKASARRSAPKSEDTRGVDDPFLFIGHGYGTSRKCLECYLWFERAPSRKHQSGIVELLPTPLMVFARFHGKMLHFGSDDALEGRVKAQYGEDYARIPVDEALERLEQIWQDEHFSNNYVPTRREWQRFCDDLERSVRTIDRLCRLHAVIKPDDGSYGLRLSDWHKRSLAGAASLAKQAAGGKQSRDLAFLAVNLLQDVVPSWKAAKRLPDEARIAWLRWLDVLIPKRYDPVDSQLVEHAAWLYESLREAGHDEALAALRPATRRAIADETRAWRST